MKIKNRMKIVVDIAMSLVLMFLMSYMLAGPEIHEWLGCVMFVLFVLHHLLNLQWHKNVFHGKYRGYRISMLAVNVLILIGMLTSMVTGIIMSKYVFTWVNISGGMALARKYHMLAAYWNFVLISLHLGLHWNMMTGMLKRTGVFEKSAIVWLFRVIALIIAVYGGYQFIQQDILKYLTCQILFAFFDFRVSVWLYVLRYMAIMECIVFLTYYIRKLYVIYIAKLFH